MTWRSATPPRRDDIRLGGSGRINGIEWRLAQGNKPNREGKTDGDLVLEIRTPKGEWRKVPFDFYGVAIMAHYGIEKQLYNGRNDAGGEYFLTHLSALVYWARQQFRPGEFQAAESWRRLVEPDRVEAAENAAQRGELQSGTSGIGEETVPPEGST